MLLDTSAWIEFFKGSTRGERVKGLIKSQPTYTSILSIAEIVNWCKRQNLDSQEHVAAINACSTILGINSEICMLAGELNYERKKKFHNWGMVDSLIVSTAKLKGFKVLSQDSLFFDLLESEPL